MDQSAYFEQMRQRRRSDILTAARHLLLKEGMDAFSMQQLAREQDISTVTLYKYFKNSDDVMEALRNNLIQQCTRNDAATFSSGDDLQDFLNNIRFSFEHILEYREDFYLIILIETQGKSSENFTTSNESFAKTLGNDFYRQQLSLLTAAEKKGQVSLPFSPEDSLDFFNNISGALMNFVISLNVSDYESQKETIWKQINELIQMFRIYLTTGSQQKSS